MLYNNDAAFAAVQPTAVSTCCTGFLVQALISLRWHNNLIHVSRFHITANRGVHTLPRALPVGYRSNIALLRSFIDGTKPQLGAEMLVDPPS